MDPGVFKPPTVAFFPNSFSLSGQGLVVGSLCKTSSSGDRWIQGLMRGLPRALFLRGNPLLHPLRELIGLQASKMLVKRDASRRTSHDGPSSDDSSSQGYDFVIAPCPRRAIRKATRWGDASSSLADEEAANVVEGQAVREAREARASDIIQKAERPLQVD
jgi:hypothetical protein